MENDDEDVLGWALSRPIVWAIVAGVAVLLVLMAIYPE